MSARGTNDPFYNFDGTFVPMERSVATEQSQYAPQLPAAPADRDVDVFVVDDRDKEPIIVDPFYQPDDRKNADEDARNQSVHDVDPPPPPSDNHFFVARLCANGVTRYATINGTLSG